MRLLLACLFLGACLPRPTPPLPPSKDEAPICTGQAAMTPDDACQGMATLHGLPCATCRDYEGCVDASTLVYCTRAYSCDDPRCALPPR